MIDGNEESGRPTIRYSAKAPSGADGRALHPIYLMETKTPAESHGPWDFFKLVDTIPAEQAFRPLSQGGCPLVK